MIKNYNQFIKESFNGFRTIGEYIESISKDNDYALNIISQYTKDIDPTVRLANVVNLLPKSTQELILKLIKDEKTGNEEPKEADVIAYTSANLNESYDVIAGKKVFQCFLKVITALGQKEISYNAEKTLKDFSRFSISVLKTKSGFIFKSAIVRLLFYMLYILRIKKQKFNISNRLSVLNTYK